MALFGYNSHRYEMVMSVCFTCIRNSTHRKLRCIGNVRTNWLMIYVPTEVMPASVVAALHSRAPGQSSTWGTEWKCHTVFVGSRVQLQDTVSAGTGSRGVSCFSSLCWMIILAVVIWQQERQYYKVSLCKRVFLKLNRHFLHWTPRTVNWSVTRFWYCRTAEDTLQRLTFLVFTDLTYLVRH